MEFSIDILAANSNSSRPAYRCVPSSLISSLHRFNVLICPTVIDYNRLAFVGIDLNGCEDSEV